MEETVKERLIKFIKKSGLSQKRFEQMAGLSNGYINNIVNEPRREKLEKILLTFPELNRVWLLTGEGDMINPTDTPQTTHKLHPEPTSGIPYYDDLPASAGRVDMVEAAELPTGYIDVPGILGGKCCFPVIGCSMEPVIHAGDIIVVDDVNNWERIDPDNVYMIVTHEERMIKHIEMDQTNDEILWCVSPNYRKFSILKKDIKFIYKVIYSFTGRAV